MTDVGVAVTNLRVVCKIIACVSASIELEMAILSFLRSKVKSQRDIKLLQVWTLCVAGYAKDADVGVCHRTSDRQEHKIIWLAGQERDTIFHLRVTACIEQGSHCRDERLAWVASRCQGTSCSSSFVSKVLGTNYKRANNFHLVAVKFTMCTGQEVTFEPTSNAHVRVDYM